MRSSTPHRPHPGANGEHHEPERRPEHRPERQRRRNGNRATVGAARWRALGALGTAAVLAAALTACTAASGQANQAGPAAKPRASTTASARSSTPPAATSPGAAGPSGQPGSVLPTNLGSIATAPTGAPPDEDINPGSGPPPTWDAASRAAVLQAAEQTMTAFARPDLVHDTWWSGLLEHVTPQSAPDLVLIDPANIPASRVTGGGRITADTSAAVATVVVPTDSGDWTLTMVRASGVDPWLADRITPPAGQH